MSGAATEKLYKMITFQRQSVDSLIPMVLPKFTIPKAAVVVNSKNRAMLYYQRRHIFAVNTLTLLLPCMLIRICFSRFSSWIALFAKARITPFVKAITRMIRIFMFILFICHLSVLITGVGVYCTHPGPVHTELYHHLPHVLDLIYQFLIRFSFKVRLLTL